MGYALPGTSPLQLVALAEEAERLGFDSAWAAEAWGTDAATVLAWTGARTSRIRLGSSVMQIAARTPAATAMTAAALDLLSGARASTSRSCARRSAAKPSCTRDGTTGSPTTAPARPGSGGRFGSSRGP